VASDIESLDGLSHSIPEALATICLFLGIAVEIRVFLGLLHRQQRLRQGLDVASGALAEVMQNYFARWKLTEAEQDVAGFAIKGYSIAEIAGFRGSAEATIKAQLNSIYRKSGAQGRAQLVSVLVEDLLRAPLMNAERSISSLH
jgi:DNA-binding CsgD family transcriptional regulator